MFYNSLITCIDSESIFFKIESYTESEVVVDRNSGILRFDKLFYLLIS